MATENPGVAETLIPVENTSPIQTGNTTRYQLNQRIAWNISYEKVWHIVRKTEERIVDTKTDELLARYIDFSARVSGLYNANKLSDYKLWFDLKSCEKDLWPKKQIEFNGYYSNIKKIGRKNE